MSIYVLVKKMLIFKFNDKISDKVLLAVRAGDVTNDQL